MIKYANACEDGRWHERERKEQRKVR